jgi:MSHA biogenesis protein MshL
MQSSGNGNTSSGSNTPAATGTSQLSEGSRISTTSKTDFWGELTVAVRGLVGAGTGRSVVTSPQAGIMAVRAMPDELREVEKFLKAAQIAVERQVMLEAKIVEVELRDGFQTGIDWSALKVGSSTTRAVGVLSGTATNPLVTGNQPNLPGFGAAASLGDGVSLPAAGTGLFGLAFASNGFQAVLGFLETRGDVQVLSSPRIATMNNQKAVLKVGSEESFINGFDSTIAITTASNVTTGSTLPTPKFDRFFSGISLDVTPQIDDSNNITLHIHPSVTNVTTKNLIFNNGASSSSSIPTASSSVNESDTVVRIQDGNIVAIGGLMQIESDRRASGLPGTSDIPVFSSLFGNRANSGRKKEVVVLIKPSIIRTVQDWEAQTRRTRAALDDMDATRARVIYIDGSVEDGKRKSAPK